MALVVVVVVYSDSVSSVVDKAEMAASSSGRIGGKRGHVSVVVRKSL